MVQISIIHTVRLVLPAVKHAHRSLLVKAAMMDFTFLQQHVWLVEPIVNPAQVQGVNNAIRCQPWYQEFATYAQIRQKVDQWDVRDV